MAINIKIEHVFLDFDGVIADTESVFDYFDGSLINEVMLQAGFDTQFSPKDIRKLAGMPIDTKLRVIAQSEGFDVEPYIDAMFEKRNRLRKTLFKEHPVTFGANFFIFMDKHANQVKMVSNKKSEQMKEDLATMGLDNILKEYIALEPGMRRKPAPDLILLALKITGANPETCAWLS